MPEISFHPIVQPTAIIAVMTALVALLWIGPSFTPVPPMRRGILIALRLCTIIVLGVCMFRPGCVARVEKPQTAVLNVVIDQSRSMELPHREDQSSRWTTAEQAVRANRVAWETLRNERLEVRFFFFDSQIHPAEYDGIVPVWPPQPTGSETDIGWALLSSMREVRDQRLIGVVLLTDGIQNVADSPVELLDAVQMMADQEIPLYAVPFGLPADTGELADLAITNLAEQHRIRVKNRLNVQATLQARGFVNQQVTVELLVSSKDEPERVVDQQLLTPRQSLEEFLVNLSFIPTDVGRYRLRVRCRGNATEVALRNNELPSFLNVYEGGSRIVYIEGETNFGQMFLRPMVRRSAEGMELEFLKVDREFPPSIRSTARILELVNDPSVDVFLLGDVDARLLGQSQTEDPVFQVLAQAVAKGKGLLMMGGYHSFGAGFYHATPLADVLPIRMSRTEGQPFSGDIRRDLHIEREFRVVPARRHFLTQLVASEDPHISWARLPPLPAANLVLGVKEAAMVLLQTDAGEPILVIGNYGAGRVACLATELTYLWRRSGHAAEFDTFWEQLLLWLSFRDELQQRTIQIDLPRRRFQPASDIGFSVLARDDSGSSLPDVEFRGTLTSPMGETKSVPITKMSDRYGGELERDWVREPGIYLLEIEGRANEQELGRSDIEFVVFDHDRERANPASDPVLLARLADQTANYGGRSVLPEELETLLTELAQNPPEMKIEVPLRWQLGQTALDGSLVLLLFVALLTTEWALRKRWQLV